MATQQIEPMAFRMPLPLPLPKKSKNEKMKENQQQTTNKTANIASAVRFFECVSLAGRVRPILFSPKEAHRRENIISTTYILHDGHDSTGAGFVQDNRKPLDIRHALCFSAQFPCAKEPQPANKDK